MGTGPDTLAPPELELRIEPQKIRPGESALLTWMARNADRVLIDHNIGVVDVEGKIKFFPEETTTYEVIAEGPGGRTAAKVTVEVVRGDLNRGELREEELRDRPLEERFYLFVKPIFFQFDSAELTEDNRLTLDGNIAWLQQPENRHLRFVIEGHCDERGTEEYNLALGEKRAQVVKDYMVARGIQAERIVTLSLGEERPFDTSGTEEGYALNRRAHFVLLQESSPAY